MVIFVRVQGRRPNFKSGSTTGIYLIFRGLKFEPDAEIGQKVPLYKSLILVLLISPQPQGPGCEAIINCCKYPDRPQERTSSKNPVKSVIPKRRRFNRGRQGENSVPYLLRLDLIDPASLTITDNEKGRRKRGLRPAV
jgi:hypothetical protein